MRLRWGIKTGFTVIELLVVVVIIGVLATVIVISYSGISQKATISSLQSDLTNASTSLKIFQAEKEYFPESISDCPNPSTNNICIRSSSDNIFSYNLAPDKKSFSLSASNSGITYFVTNNSAPAPKLVTEFDFYLSGDGLLKSSSTGVVAKSYDGVGFISTVVTATLYGVSESGVESQITTKSISISNFTGNLAMNLDLAESFSLDPNGKLRLRINDGHVAASFEFNLNGQYSSAQPSTMLLNFDAWAYYDDEDDYVYNGFSFGNPEIYRGIVTRLLDVKLL